MRFKKHISLVIALMALLCLSGSRPAHSQESAIDRIKARLNKSGTVSPSEARAAANEASAAAEANRLRTEAAVKAAETGEDPGIAVADSVDGAIIDPETAPMEEEVEELDADLPSLAGMDFGSETEEAGVADIFKDPLVIGDLSEGAFIYESAGIPDPMVFPQIRNDTIFSELWARHEVLLKEAGIKNTKDFDRVDRATLDVAKVEEAIQLLGRVKEMNDSRFDEQLDSQVKALQGLMSAPPPPSEGSKKGDGPPVPSPTEPCPLPEQIKAELRFVIATGDDTAYCLIGDYMVRVGDPVPDFPEVRPISIQEGKVIFEINSPGCIPSTEEVSISPTLDEGFFGKYSGKDGKSLLGMGFKGGAKGGSKSMGGRKVTSEKAVKKDTP